MQSLSERELLERVKDVSAMPRNVQQSSTDLTLLNADLMDMDFSDNLFSSLNQPFAFPNPRELGQSMFSGCVVKVVVCHNNLFSVVSQQPLLCSVTTTSSPALRLPQPP